MQTAELHRVNKMVLSFNVAFYIFAFYIQNSNQLLLDGKICSHLVKNCEEACSEFRASANNIDTLQMVQVIFRHGERTPTVGQRFPKDLLINETYFPYGNGQITLRGKINSYLFGMKLRERYNNFLGHLYYDGVIESIASDCKPSQMALQAVHAALFETSALDELFLNFTWQPIPYKILPWKEDEMLMFYRRCPEVYNFGINLENRDPNNEEFYQYLRNHTGYCRLILQIEEIYGVYDTLYIADQLGYTLPDWTQKVYPEPLRKESLKRWNLNKKYRLKLAAGPLLSHLQNVLERKMTKKIPDATKMFLYSGHDSNIAAFLGALDYEINAQIECNSAIYLELHYINNVYGVKVFVQNGLDDEIHQLCIKDCGYFCPVAGFKALTEYLYDPWPVCQTPALF